MVVRLPDVAGLRILEALVELFAATGCVLFELDDAVHLGFEVTATVGATEDLLALKPLSKQSPLPRWLRVNASSLPVPDAIGVFETLPSSEQETLRRIRSELAVPLLHDDELVAWVSLSGIQNLPSSRPSALDERILQAAANLKAARHAAQDRANSEAITRSNRLSVAGQIAAGIAHEVRNPLAAVRSMVQLVRTETAPLSERQRLLDNVVAEVDRVNRVLSGMLALGRPTATRDERTDIAALAADAASFCSAYAKQQSQIIQTALPESLWVQGDPHELRQVLVNLLLNACQASRSGQTILVDGASKSGSGDAPQITIRIMDPGEGMPKHVLDRVFEPFFTTKQDGGGLGLSICRDAIQRHGGNITIASEPQVGTVVSVELPQAPHDTNPGC